MVHQRYRGVPGLRAGGQENEALRLRRLVSFALAGRVERFYPDWVVGGKGRGWSGLGSVRPDAAAPVRPGHRAKVWAVWWGWKGVLMALGEGRGPSVRRGLTLALVVALVALGGMAVATAGDDPSLHACAHNRTGLMRLVDSPEDCLPAETPVSWNQAGLSGAAVEFYVVDYTEGPPPEPADPTEPQDDGEIVNRIEYEPGDWEATCDPGDAVMSGAFWLVQDEWRTNDYYGVPGDPIPWDTFQLVHRTNEFRPGQIVVLADTSGTPLGYTNTTDLGISSWKGWYPDGPATRQTNWIEGELICADLTP